MSFRDVRSAENLFPKTNRNDRYKQMTKQQQLIEEKKRQIQEKLNQKRKKDAEEASPKVNLNDTKIERKPLVFSNDGSFLDQFKKIAGMTGLQSSNNENESEDTKSRDVENNNRVNTSGGEQAVQEEIKQVPALPPPLPPELPPSGYQQQQSAVQPYHQPPPPYLSFGVPPPPPPVPPPLLPPPLIPQSAPPPLAPQSIPPPRPINVQNIPPPPIPVPPPPLLPCFPPLSAQFQPPPPGPPMPNLMLPPPNFNPPQVPPDNVQQGTALGGVTPPAQPDHFSPPSHPPEQPPSTNNNNWFPPRPPSTNSSNVISPLRQELVLEPRNENKEELNSAQSASRVNERKRKSRWSDEKASVKPVDIVPSVPKINVTGMSGHMLTKVTRTDPGLLQYALTAYGSTSLTEEDWKKAEENYKVHLLYQDMMKKRAALEKLKEAGKHKYEYDSDEEIDEKGTWEHKLRDKEMMATQEWAQSLTEMAKGKHHIGDFLPPDELKKFMAKYQAVKGGREPDLSDYKEYKLGEENKGFQMLQKLGWSEGQGLGSDGGGRLDPINKGQMREFNEGLGHTRPDDITTGDDEYDAYRKRMMLAYRFRPNPLNNPRRPYY